MKIIKNTTNYTISADVGKRIVRKNNPFHSYISLIVPLYYDINNLIELDETNSNVIDAIETQKIISVDYSNLNDAKKVLIQHTKKELDEFLLNNPLVYNDKLYSVTASTQQHLDSLIAAAEDAKQLGIDFTPYWNDAYGKREVWELADLRILRIKIQQYLLPFIMQQQNMEEQILNTDDMEKLRTMHLGYQK